MNYMGSEQMFAPDLSATKKSNSVDYIDENEDFQSSITVIKFNESLINFDAADDNLLEETFHLNKSQVNSNLNDLFEEGFSISLSPEKLEKLKK